MLWSHLEFFLATARHGTLSAAAKELDVNHTTVSRRIASLEKEFQIKLFKRKNTGYILTEHGENLLAEVRNIEKMINQTKSKFISEIIFSVIHSYTGILGLPIMATSINIPIKNRKVIEK